MFGLDRKVLHNGFACFLPHSHMSGCSGRCRHHIQEAGEGDVGQTKGSAICVGVSVIFIVSNSRRSSRGRRFEASIRGSSEVNILMAFPFLSCLASRRLRL
jgi:hypothetical protein